MSERNLILGALEFALRNARCDYLGAMTRNDERALRSLLHKTDWRKKTSPHVISLSYTEWSLMSRVLRKWGPKTYRGTPIAYGVANRRRYHV